MWLSFYLGWLLGAILLVVPGMLVAKGLRADRTVALLVSPLLTCGIYSVMAIAYAALGIPCGWVTMAIPTMVVGGLLCILTKALKLEPIEALSVSNELRRPLSSRCRLSISTLSIIAAVLTGIAVTYVIWVSNIHKPTNFVQFYDNGWHLTRIAEFMDQANYSSFLSGAFYPSGWHGTAAMIGSMVNVTAPAAENISLVIFSSVLYPLSTVLLLETLFEKRPRRVFLGSVVCLSVAFFPWRTMLWGPLYPNTAAFSVMPAAVALFIRLVRDASGIRNRLLSGLFFIAGGISMCLLQPNAVFSCGVFLIPFCLNRVRAFATDRYGTRTGIMAEVGTLILFAGIWLGLVYAPFMHGVVWYKRVSPNDFMQAIRWGLDLCFIMRRPQYFIGAVVVLGGLVVLFEREVRWVAPAYAMTLVLYIAAFGIPSPVKNIIAGFWYSDYWRLADAVCVFAIPLAACGMDILVEISMLPFSRGKRAKGDNGNESHTSLVARGVATVVVLAVLAVNYFPLEVVHEKFRTWAFDTVKHNVYTTVSPVLYEYASIPPEEGDFLVRVAEITGDKKVFNNPYDGSLFAYSAYGINTEYRYLGPSISSSNEDLRVHLNEIADSAEIQRDAQELGVVYLLQLDQGDGSTGLSDFASYFNLGYDKREWTGFNAVRDDTPGFTLLLAEADMRLYKLDIAA